SVSPVGSSSNSPTGTVQFQIDGSTFGGPMALVDGSASIAISKLAAGNHTVSAVYSGDSNFLGLGGSLSGGLVVTPTPLTITVDRSGSGGGVTVHYTTSDGTALAGTDYAAASGTLVFDAGETSKTFLVPILNNSLAAGDKTVNLTLSSPTGGAVLGGSGTGA